MSSEKSYLNDNYKSFFEDGLSVKDPELYKAIKDELIRQQQHIELIASENIVSQAVLEAQGSVLTNKYAEGYPGKRYYNGCEHVDVAENLANDRLKKLFNCKFANSQPHSGAQVVHLSEVETVSYTHLRAPRDKRQARMPSSA